MPHLISGCSDLNKAKEYVQYKKYSLTKLCKNSTSSSSSGSSARLLRPLLMTTSWRTQRAHWPNIVRICTLNLSRRKILYTRCLVNANQPHPHPHHHPVFYEDVSFAFALPSSRLSSASSRPLLSVHLPHHRHPHLIVGTAVVFWQAQQLLSLLFDIPAPENKPLNFLQIGSATLTSL